MTRKNLKLRLTEVDLNELHRTVSKRRPGTKMVTVNAEALFDLLRDYADLYRVVTPEDEQRP